MLYGEAAIKDLLDRSAYDYGESQVPYRQLCKFRQCIAAAIEPEPAWQRPD